MSSDERVAVKFSGGRDSSLVASLYCLSRRPVSLLRFATGFGIPSPLPEIRVAELTARFGDLVQVTSPIPVQGLVRRIAVADIEQDFRDFAGYNLVLLGEGLALHARSVAECVIRGFGTVADGSTRYQQEMPEQRTAALELFSRIAARYDIQYETPVAHYESADDVKYELLDLGLSTKSLEGVSMFSDSFSTAPDDVVVAYLERKIPIAIAFIDRVVGSSTSP